MKPTHLAVLALTLLIPSTVVAAGNQFAREGEENLVYINRALNQRMTATCSGELSPDRAVIEGGVSTEGLKPQETNALLEREVEAIRQYLTQKGGILHLQEKVRAIRARPARLSEPDRLPLPFVVAQRLRIDLPLDVNIDEVLERLLQLGLDRYGGDFRFDRPQKEPQVIVHYAFGDLEARLDEIYEKCFTGAIASWCQANAPATDEKTCREVLMEARPRFVTHTMDVQSQPVLGEHGLVRRLRLTFPWENSLQDVRLLGKIPLRLQGTIRVSLKGKQEE